MGTPRWASRGAALAMYIKTCCDLSQMSVTLITCDLFYVIMLRLSLFFFLYASRHFCSYRPCIVSMEQ